MSQNQIIGLLERIERQIEAERERTEKKEREFSHTLRKIERVLEDIEKRLKPRLSDIAIAFTPSTKGDLKMPTQGPVTLTTAGQVTTASVLGFDQSGNPMPSDFVMPAVTFAIDNPGIATSAPNADGTTSVVTAVANGVANLSASVTSAEGLALSDTETVTVNIPVTPPPTPVLSSIKIAFS